jgi:hypothetical protein
VVEEMLLTYEKISTICSDDGNGFTKEYISGLRNKIVLVYRTYVKAFSDSIHTQGIVLETVTNETQFDQIIIDTAEDLKRLKDFHPIETPNAIKEACYLAYWSIRRKPVFVKNEVSGLNVEDKHKTRMLFLNEFVMAAYIVSSIFDTQSTICMCEDVDKFKTIWKQARNYLLYYLVYRLESPKSLEAFAVGCTLHPIWKLRDDFWGGSV